MKKPKLSAAQVKALRALAEPGAVAHYEEDRGSFRFGGGKRFSGWLLPACGFAEDSTIRCLFIKGFIFTDGKQATITPAGRAYLAELDKEAP